MVLSSTPKAVIKDSSKACKKTLSLRNKYLLDQIESCSGSSEKALIIQTSKIVKSFSEENRSQILKEANISPIEIDEKEIVALKVNLGIPWEKVKSMAR